MIPCQYDAVGDFCNGLACVQKDGKYGFINTEGKLVIPMEYDNVTADFTAYGIAAVQLGTEHYAIRSDGSVVIEPGYGRLILSDTSLVLAYKNKTWYALDLDKNTVY